MVDHGVKDHGVKHSHGGSWGGTQSWWIMGWSTVMVDHGMKHSHGGAWVEAVMVDHGMKHSHGGSWCGAQ